MRTKGSKKTEGARRMLRYDMSEPEDKPVEQTSYVLYIDNPFMRKLPPDGIPTSQDEIDVIPVNRRGLSFFTSKPALDTALIAINIPVGNSVRVVHALPVEVEAIRAGKMPLVRCFVVNGKLIPWYEWGDYCPYLDYFAAEADDWIWFGSSVVACCLPVEALSVNIDRYLEAEASTLTFAGEQHEEHAGPWRRHRFGTAPAANVRQQSGGGLRRASRRSEEQSVLGSKKPASDALERIRCRLVYVVEQIESLDPQLETERTHLDAVEARLRRKLDRLVIRQLASAPDELRHLAKAVCPTGNLAGPLRSPARRHAIPPSRQQREDAIPERSPIAEHPMFEDV